MPRLRSAAVLLSLLVLVRSTASPAEDPAVAFRPIEMAEPATMMALTEDGKFLVVSHQGADAVSVFDAATGKLDATIDTPSPRNVLCRGGGVYVSSPEQRTVRFFAARGGWELTDQYKIDAENIVHLSAAQRDHFDGRILVTCHGPGRQGSYVGPKTFLLTARRGGRAVPVGGHALATVGYDGKLVFTQGSFNLSPSGDISGYPFATFLTPRPEPTIRGGVQQTPFVYQSHPGSYMVGANMVFAGNPIKLLKDGLGDIVIPDLSERLVYSLTKFRLTAHRLNTQLGEVGSREVAFPKAVADHFGAVSDTLHRRRDYLLDHPIGWTEGNELRLFVLDTSDNSILAATTPAFAPGAGPRTPIRGEPGDAAAPADDPAPPPTDTPIERGAAARRSGGRPGGGDKAPEAATDGEFGVPRYASPGDRIRVKLKGALGAQFDLRSGPKGMTLTVTGLLQWTPSDDQVGVHPLQIRVKTGKEVAFADLSIEVVAKDLLGPDGAPKAVDGFPRLALETDEVVLTAGRGYRSLLLLQGERLRVLGPDGLKVTKELTLPRRYSRFAEREDCYVAAGASPAVLDLIDKTSGKVRKSADLDAALRVLKVTGLAVHPQRGDAYVAVEHDIEVPRYRIVIVSPDAGSVEAPEGLLGTWVEADPAGRYLYAGYRDIYERGSRFHVNPDWRVIETPEYGAIDWFIAYEVRGRRLTPKALASKAGGNGKGIRLSADGRRATYLSAVGTPSGSGNLASWNPADVREKPVVYATKGVAGTTALAYHPTLPIVAVPGGNSVVLFDRETGKPLENRLRLTAAGLGDAEVRDLMFSPDGRSLTLVCADAAGELFARGVELRLGRDEEARASKVPQAAAPVKTVRQAIDPAELDALKAPQAGPELTPKEIGRRYLGSVVSVESGEGSGTGFVVGRHGYVLTCAHVLPADGKVTVTALPAAGKAGGDRPRPATVVMQDDDRDLALLKVTSSTDFSPVVLGEGPAEAGEAVTVIGNPGLGEAVLTQTITTGVVSSPARRLEGRTLIQTSAAVNPGNSGGPMFDGQGKVIGLVVLKGAIEGAAFAVPAAELRRFLKEATVASK